MGGVSDDSGDSGTGHASGDRRLDELIAAAKGGCDSALGRALTACRPRLLRTARRRLAPALRPIVGASDIVQDTFVNATKGFPRFKGERASQFLHWLNRILSNRIAQIARRDGQPRHNVGAHFSGNGDHYRLSGLLATDQESPSSIAGNDEDADLIRASLARLSERDQQILQLRIGDRFNFAQIGQRTDLNEDAARMSFARAVERLRRELHDKGWARNGLVAVPTIHPISMLSSCGAPNK